jgi:hypothetical protein
MSDFLDAGRHFPSPKFWLFETEMEFFNTHIPLHSEPPVGRSVSEMAIFRQLSSP